MISSSDMLDSLLLCDAERAVLLVVRHAAAVEDLERGEVGDDEVAVAGLAADGVAGQIDVQRVAQLALAQTLKLGKLAHSVVGCSVKQIEKGSELV